MISQIDFLFLLASKRPSTTIKNGLDWFDLIRVYKTTIKNAYSISQSKVEFSRHIFKLGYQVDFSGFLYDNWQEIYKN